jgi:excinuclease ABC subunit C
VFPFYTQVKHPKLKCTWCHLDLCPGPNPNLKLYKDNIKKLVLVLKGKSTTVLNSLKKEMTSLAKQNKFEEAGKVRNTIYSLQQVMSHTNAIENPKFEIKNSKLRLAGRIECYDISNIQGKFATGSMIVFIDGKPDKNQYRKFKIKSGNTPNDIAMLKEVLERRFSHPEWKYPDIILIDGGKAQLNVAIGVKNNLQPNNYKLQAIKIISVAKGKQELFIEGEKYPIPLKDLPQKTKNLILQLDAEAHRFAISYHRFLRSKKTLLQ